MDLSCIVASFFTFSNNLKLYHWNTQSFARHKATDALHGSFASFMDQFVETMSATYGRPRFSKDHDLTLTQWSDKDAVIELEALRYFLVHDLSEALSDDDVDLINLRDGAVSDINQALYLFTFS